MRKRVIAAALVICLAVVMGLTGCGDNKPYGKYDLNDYIKIGTYKGLETEKIKVSVSDKDIEERIKSNVQNTKTTEKLEEGKVKDGDKVNIDYKGIVDGEAFDGGSAEAQDLTIGSKSFIDGFEDGLIGAAIGSTKTLNLTFPKDYGKEDLNGKKVKFEVKINYISKDVVPEYNEAWIQKNSKVKTEKEYEASVKQELTEEKKQTAINEQKSKLWTTVVEASEVTKYPEDELKSFIAKTEETYESMAKQQGVEVKDLWEQYGIKSQKDFDTQNEENAKQSVKQEMVLYYIAEKEGLSYTEDEANKVKESITQAGYTEETFKQAMGQTIDEYLELNLTYEKVLDFIYKDAKIVDKVTQKTDKEETKETTTNKETENTKETEKDKGADDATSNDEPGGADA